MQVLPTRVDTRSEAYRSNREAFLRRIEDLRTALAKVNEGGGPKYVERHHRRGKLMARERIELLLDRDSPFLEIAPLAAWGTDFALGGSVVSGIGVVSGVECVISANEPTIRGGSINPYGQRKTARTMEICAQNRLPIVQLTESGGADLPTRPRSSSRAAAASARSRGARPSASPRSAWCSDPPPRAGPTCPG